MKHFSLSAMFALAMAAVGFVHSASAGEQVPLKGALSGTVTVTPVAPPLVVDVLVDATGNATHLGEFQVVIPHRVDRSQTPPRAVGTYLFLTANGDELHAEFTGNSMLIVPGLLYIEETATITGGTGRFVGATGEFICTRLFDQVAGTTVGDFRGTISSVGSN